MSTHEIYALSENATALTALLSKLTSSDREKFVGCLETLNDCRLAEKRNEFTKEDRIRTYRAIAFISFIVKLYRCDAFETPAKIFVTWLELRGHYGTAKLECAHSKM